MPGRTPAAKLSEAEMQILAVGKGLNKDRSDKKNRILEKSAKLQPMEEVNIGLLFFQKYIDIFLKTECRLFLDSISALEEK